MLSLTIKRTRPSNLPSVITANSPTHAISTKIQAGGGGRSCIPGNYDEPTARASEHDFSDLNRLPGLRTSPPMDSVSALQTCHEVLLEALTERMRLQDQRDAALERDLRVWLTRNECLKQDLCGGAEAGGWGGSMAHAEERDCSSQDKDWYGACLMGDIGNTSEEDEEVNLFNSWDSDVDTNQEVGSRHWNSGYEIGRLGMPTHSGSDGILYLPPVDPHPGQNFSFESSLEARDMHQGPTTAGGSASDSDNTTGTIIRWIPNVLLSTDLPSSSPHTPVSTHTQPQPPRARKISIIMDYADLQEVSQKLTQWRHSGQEYNDWQNAWEDLGRAQEERDWKPCSGGESSEEAEGQGRSDDRVDGFKQEWLEGANRDEESDEYDMGGDRDGGVSLVVFNQYGRGRGVGTGSNA